MPITPFVIAQPTMRYFSHPFARDAFWSGGAEAYAAALRPRFEQEAGPLKVKLKVARGWKEKFRVWRALRALRRRQQEELADLIY